MVSAKLFHNFIAEGKKENRAVINKSVTNTEAFGQVLYTDYLYFLEAAGILLLIAMIGAIVLTLRERIGVRRQRIAEQVSRPRDAVVELHDVPTGSGA